jgi:hypothetical protein
MEKEFPVPYFGLGCVVDVKEWDVFHIEFIKGRKSNRV